MKRRPVRVVSRSVPRSRLARLRVRLDRPAGAVGALLFPPLCARCDVEAEEPPLCGVCRALLMPQPPSACRRCGFVAGRPGRCPRCRRRRFAFCALAAPFRYRGAARDLLLRAKFGGEPMALEPFVAPMARCAASRGFAAEGDLVAWVPLSFRRRLRRGFDQSEWLARRVARRLGLPCLRLLTRRHRRPVSRLPARARARAVAGTFGVRRGRRKRIEGRRVLLVDDVLTTGSTLDEAARALIGAGARDVRAVVAAVS